MSAVEAALREALHHGEGEALPARPIIRLAHEVRQHRRRTLGAAVGVTGAAVLLTGVAVAVRHADLRPIPGPEPAPQPVIAPATSANRTGGER